MLQPKKKISRKEIKEDKLVTRTMQIEAWALENKKSLTYVVVGVVALAVLLFVWRGRVATAEEEAATRLANIMSVYDAGSWQDAIDGVPSQGKQFGLRSIAEEYGGTVAGEFSKLFYATALTNLLRYEEALKVYEDIDHDDRLITASRESGQGICLEALGRYAEAAKAFERAAGEDPQNPLAPDRLVMSARNYGKAGNPEQARDVLETLRKQYPTSAYARDVDRYLAEFAS
ncbi:MAG: hypothetical protein A2X67_09465 [Ignavibacteria bacterium GWA2_55_11]|nr:MAG: hypothetical protein A2X67_09465 [Ignavibacteria bacterium GWA2_55_11]